MACVYQTWQTSDDNSATADSFPPTQALHKEERLAAGEEESASGELTAVRYHRARPQRAFPPPLPSMSRRRGDDARPCLQMRPHSRDGRLVLEVVAV
jgi:hypothetical protein